MAENKKQNTLLHKRSVKKGVLPQGEILQYGEIAVNYNSEEPFLSIRKDGENKEYAKFSADEVIAKMFDEKYVTIEDLEDNEEVIASALTELNDSKENISAKVQIISSESTTYEYPSAKAVYDYAAPISHNHDDRYYTESEIDKKFDDVASRYGFGNILVGDKTVTADISVDTLILKGENGITLTPELDTDTITIAIESDKFAPKSHTHTKSEITDFAHNHDDRYYTESEVDAKISGITAASLGLSAALKYCGITTTPLTDGDTTNPVVIDGKNHIAEQGCVVFYEEKVDDKTTTKEFVFNGTKWELLGSDLTYKVVQKAVSSPNANGNAVSFIDTISQDANGVITATKKNVDMPIVKGDVENSAVLKGGNNQVISEGGVALGKDNLVGLKGWYYGSIYKENDNTISVYLSNEQKAFNSDEDFKTEYQTADESLPNLVEILGVNAVISLVNAGKYDDKFIVIGGSNGVVRLQTIDESALPFDIITGQSVINYEDYSIYCLSKPDAGIAELGKYSFAVGYNNKVTNGESTAFGNNNHAYGKFSFVEGKDNKAGYTSHAEGRSNIASGSISHAEGRNNVASGYLSHAEGGDNTAKGARSHAEGYSTKANGNNSHAEGENSQANGKRAHAEGYNTRAIGEASHAEGFSTKANGAISHAEGYCTTAKGESSHAEGSSDNIAATIEESDTKDGFAGLINKWINTKFSLAYGHSAHIEGRNNLALGNISHAEGSNTTAKGIISHAEGNGTKAEGTNSHAEGYCTTAIGESSHAEGNDTTATGYSSHAEGNDTTAEGTNSHAEGSSTTAIGESSHAEGRFSQANGRASHSEGFSTKALGESSHAEGNDTKAEGINSHAEGNKSYSLGNHSHAEGSDTKTEGVSSHAEGYKSQALGNNSHAEGNDTKAEGINSHAEGYKSQALGTHSHAEGNSTITEGSCAHAEGYKTQALGKYSHAEGNNTISKNEAEHACGKYNLSNSDTRFSIGIGTSDTNRKNAFEVKQNGDIYIEGVEGRIQDKLDKLVNITYSQLKNLRKNSKLIPGQQYRITDYTTTTVQENTQSAGHQFDVIVTADDVNVLNENARAIQHDGDTYFSNSDLNAWELKYCLDNDTSRFAWADDSDNGKGVIYYMKDEFNNECSYDFKNIQFARWELSNPVGYRNDYDFDNYEDNWVEETTPFDSLKDGFYGLNGSTKEFSYGYDGYDKYKVEYTISESPTYCYTFGNGTDYSINGSNYGNIIKEYKNSNKIKLNNIVFLGNYCNYNNFGNYCYNNSFGNNCDYNSFGNDCYSNSFGNDCYSNSFGNDCYSNSFGNTCYSNSFGNKCYYNSFGNYCYYNSFGNYCYNNSFGNYCYNNSFGNYCYSNSFGNNCDSNSLGNECYYNSFGDSCSNNSFGNYCYNNSFGNYCYSNSFGNKCYNNSFVYKKEDDSEIVMDNVKKVHFGDGCNNIKLYADSDIVGTISNVNSIQNIDVAQGLSFNSSTIIELTTLGQDYEIKVARNSAGDIKVFCLADLIA